MTDIYSPPTVTLSKRPAGSSGYGSVEDGIAGNYKFSISEIFSEAWAKIGGSKGTVWLAALFYILGLILLTIGVNIIVSILGLSARPEDPEAHKALSNLIFQLLHFPISMALAGGMYMLGIKLVAGIPVQAKEVFAHFKRIVPLSIAMILMGLLITIGFILLIIPGIYLAVAYTMAMPLILEKNMSPWQALETSRKTITRHWFRMCGFIIANTILGIVATLLLGIGLIWYVPFSLICLGLIYRNMFGFSDELVQS